jgi:uncharacterized protein (DUF1810 family)
MEQQYELERFVQAQAPVYDTVLAELRAGHKRSHWMWFIFPQIAGLGRSAMAQLYAIGGADEARAYLDHPLLGERLRECTEALNALRVPDAEAIFGGTDAMKLKSSLTLFDTMSRPAGPFDLCLARYFGGARDAATLHLLG